MALRPRHMSLFLALAFSAASVALAASPALTPASANACQRWGDSEPSDLSRKQARKAILCLLNERRENAGVRPLDRHKRLEKAAQRHTRRMDGSGCFDHTCRGEADLSDRLRSVDYLTGDLLSWMYGENIAWGMGSLGTPGSIVDAWMRSPGHRINILNGKFRDIGVGFAAGTPSDGGDRGGIYTTDFGFRT